MKSLLRFCLVALGLILAPSAFAANCATTAYASTPGTFPSSPTATFTATDLGVACTFVSGNELIFNGDTGAGSYTLNGSTSISGLLSTGATAGVFLLHGAGDTLTVNNGTTNTTFDIHGISYCNANPCTAPVSNARNISFTNTGGTVSITTGASTSAPYNQFGTLTLNGSGGTFELLDNAIMQSTTFTAGTLDATTNNTSPTFTTAGGTTIPAVGILNCGTGTWTFTQNTGTSSVLAITAGATLSCASATLSFPNATNGNTRELSFQSNSFGTLSIGCAGSTGPSNMEFAAPSSATVTLGTWTFASSCTTYPFTVYLTGHFTVSLTNAPTWAGTSGNFLTLYTQPNLTTTTIALPTTSPIDVSWMAFSNITFTGTSSTVTATNSLDMSGNNNFNGGSISPPSFGGGGHIIGG